MKQCKWCEGFFDGAFIETHHLNHIHEDDRPENMVEICIKCHQRHHKESGYDTIIIKKGEYKPKTLEDEIQEIVHRVFLQRLEERLRSTKMTMEQVAGLLFTPTEKIVESLKMTVYDSDRIQDFTSSLGYNERRK